MSFGQYASSGNNAKFPNPGDSVAGVVIAVKLLDDQFNPGEKVNVIELDSGDESVSLWVSSFKMGQAILNATSPHHGTDGPAPGGHLTVTFTGMGTAQPGKNAPKLYEVQYTPPAQAAQDAAAAAQSLV